MLNDPQPMPEELSAEMGRNEEAVMHHNTRVLVCSSLHTIKCTQVLLRARHWIYEAQDPDKGRRQTIRCMPGNPGNTDANESRFGAYVAHRDLVNSTIRSRRFL